MTDSNNDGIWSLTKSFSAITLNINTPLIIGQTKKI